MRKLLIALALIASTGDIFAQSSGLFTKVRITDSLWVNGKWVSGFTSVVGNSDSKIPTEAAVKTFVEGKVSLLNTDAVPEGSINKYYSNVQARGAFSATTPITYSPSTGIYGWNGNTSSVPEGSNLYYTDGRARGAFSGTLPITYNSSTGAIGWNGSTSQVTEGSNLYYTDTRARAAFSAGINITISPAGLISATVPGTPTWQQVMNGSNSTTQMPLIKRNATDTVFKSSWFDTDFSSFEDSTFLYIKNGSGDNVNGGSSYVEIGAWFNSYISGSSSYAPIKIPQITSNNLIVVGSIQQNSGVADFNGTRLMATGQQIRGVAFMPDADFTLTDGAAKNYVILPAPAANRSITLPASNLAGTICRIILDNPTSAFKWSTNTIYQDGNETSTTLVSDQTLFYQGTSKPGGGTQPAWRKISGAPRTTTGTWTPAVVDCSGFNITEATYKKVGNTIEVFYVLEFTTGSSTTNSGGSVILTGFPLFGRTVTGGALNGRFTVGLCTGIGPVLNVTQPVSGALYNSIVKMDVIGLPVTNSELMTAGASKYLRGSFIYTIE